MQRQQNRREFVQAAVVAAGLVGCQPGATPSASTPSSAAALQNRLVELEAELKGRIGVYAFTAASGHSALEYRADERFAMCSTFKWALAAATLEHVDRSTEFFRGE